MQLISPEYKALLEKRYEQPGWGGSGKGWKDTVASFAFTIEASTVLDYGCGRGTLKPALAEYDWLTVSEYDPGIIGKDGSPEPADLVVCTDVLEHIEPDKLDLTLAHLLTLARKGLFINIGLGPAKEVLPDGRNAHLIQWSAEEWQRKLYSSGFRPGRYQRDKGLRVWVRRDTRKD